MIDPGWKGVAKISEKKKDDPDDTALGDISSLHEGDEIKIAQAGVKAGKTTPPKSYTEDTLLSAMEKAGSDETPDEAERKGHGKDDDTCGSADGCHLIILVNLDSPDDAEGKTGNQRDYKICFRIHLKGSVPDSFPDTGTENMNRNCSGPCGSSLPRRKHGRPRSAGCRC